MPEFTRRWNNFSTEVGVTPVPEAPFVTSGTPIQGTYSGKTFSRPGFDAFSDHLLFQLQTGSRWLTLQYQAWLDHERDAANDEEFSVVLATWTELEQELRESGYQACIYGAQQRCPQNAPVRCDSCVAAIFPPLQEAKT